MAGAKITYFRKGPRARLGFETDWLYTEVPFSEEKYRSLKLLSNFGAIQNLQVK